MPILSPKFDAKAQELCQKAYAAVVEESTKLYNQAAGLQAKLEARVPNQIDKELAEALLAETREILWVLWTLHAYCDGTMVWV